MLISSGLNQTRGSKMTKIIIENGIVSCHNFDQSSIAQFTEQTTLKYNACNQHAFLTIFLLWAKISSMKVVLETPNVKRLLGRMFE